MHTLLLAILLITFILLIALLGIGYLFQKRIVLRRQKSSPYECGLDPNASARVPFSLRLFLLAVIFLVLDVEIALLMATPLPLIKDYYNVVIVRSIFLLILIVGLVHE